MIVRRRPFILYNDTILVRITTSKDTYIKVPMVTICPIM
jgi:hypothetical protein